MLLIASEPFSFGIVGGGEDRVAVEEFGQAGEVAVELGDLLVERDSVDC